MGILEGLAFIIIVLGALGLGNAFYWLGTIYCDLSGYGTFFSSYGLSITSAIVFEYSASDPSRFRCQAWFEGSTIQIASGGTNPPSITYDGKLRFTSGSTNPESVTALVIHHNL